MNRAIATIFIALSPSAVFAGAVGEAPDAVLPADEARMSVEIPLAEPLRVAGAELLRVNELLDERTEFRTNDFRLDELVLVARSETDTAGQAELLIMDWRSGEFDIPAAGEDEWYEVRIPAPKEELGGAWLLDLVGDVTVDMLVAVLEPLPEAAARHAPARTRTVYRVVDGRPARVITRWVHSPRYYHVYHYHHGWPYRYFWGPWHYDLVYRPQHRHYRHHGHRQVRHKHRDSHRHHRKLRRVHPRARVFAHVRHSHRADRGTRHAETREHHPGRQLRTRRGEQRRHAANTRPPAAAEHAGANTRSRASRPARHDRDVARPLPKRRDYARAAESGPTRPSAQPRRASRATPTPPRTQAPHRAPPRASARPTPRRDFARQATSRPAVAPAERRAYPPTTSRLRSGNRSARPAAPPSRTPQRATPSPAPARRALARPPVRVRGPASAPARTVTEVRSRAPTAQPRRPPATAPRHAAERDNVESPRQADAPRSRRPS